MLLSFRIKGVTAMGKRTKRLSLKTIAFKFPLGSMERTYLHGMWAKSRGKNPSLLVRGNHASPRDAFQSAQECVGPYLEEIRQQPFSRQWDWENPRLVEAILNNVPAERVGKYDF